MSNRQLAENRGHGRRRGRQLLRRASWRGPARTSRSIGRAQHVEAIARNGLLLETADGTQTIAVSATVDPAAVRDARWILFCVKSIDTEEAARAIAPHLMREPSF